MPEAREEVRRFERFPLVIGRSAGCDLVLRDESRFISSNHAIITLVDGAPCVRDTSSNGLFVNGSAEPLGRGNEMPLHDRDVLGVGDYTLTVSFGSTADAVPDDPFDALLADDMPAEAAPTSAPEQSFDPWHGDAPDWSETKPSASSDPFALSTDGPDVPPGGDDTSASGGASSAATDDWPDWPSDPSPAATPAPAPAPRRHGSPPDRLVKPPRGSAAAPASGTREPPPTMHGAHGDALLLQCIEGLMALLRSRSELKQAMRTDVTSLRGTGNNPLKFSRDGREALTRLLDPSPGGEYLSPEAALGEAIDDLTLHQLAMLDGMKAAVGALLGRFDPDSLTERLTADHPIAATIPVTRDAKLWQLFREHYDEIEQAARGDFTAVFGREFLKAYEARIRKLGREPDLW